SASLESQARIACELPVRCGETAGHSNECRTTSVSPPEITGCSTKSLRTSSTVCSTEARRFLTPVGSVWGSPPQACAFGRCWVHIDEKAHMGGFQVTDPVTGPYTM